jgi:hypothetical protein
MRTIMSRASRRGPETLRVILVPITFLALAGVLLAYPGEFTGPVPDPIDVPGWATDPSPVRRPSLEPRLDLIGYAYACSDCHRLFPSPLETVRTLTQHTHIALNHGINTRCHNCHHRTDRAAFVDDHGNPIPYGQPQWLCARCHGLVFRDWQHGVHGRSNGFWDTNRGPLTRLKCIECHDPHQPAFAPMSPAPGPHTLRMGTPPEGAHAPGQNPLQVEAEEDPR